MSELELWSPLRTLRTPRCGSTAQPISKIRTIMRLSLETIRHCELFAPSPVPSLARY